MLEIDFVANADDVHKKRKKSTASCFQVILELSNTAGADRARGDTGTTHLCRVPDKDGKLCNTLLKLPRNVRGRGRQAVVHHEQGLGAPAQVPPRPRGCSAVHAR